MFGKHNKIQQNKENIDEALESSERSEWQKVMDEVPTFDQHLRELAVETEKPLNLESLKEFSGFSKQLEKMGANQEITSNPAFERVLKEILFISGLQTGVALVRTDNERNNKRLDLACQRDKARNTGSNQHDCSNFQISVKNDGNFTIDFAYIDRSNNREIERDFFPGLKINSRIEKVNAYEDVNSASSMKFVKQHGSDGFNVEIINIYESQMVPVAESDNVRIGHYFQAASATTRRFNKDGQENSREDTDYEPRDFDGLNMFINRSGDASPKSASFNGLSNFARERFSRRTKESFSYKRNPDGKTLTAEKYDGSARVTKKSVWINSEHGTDDLIVAGNIFSD